MNTKNKKDIIYGNIDLDPDTFAPQNVKERITTMVDQDALEAFKKIADKKNIKYQTLLNQVIRNFVGLNRKRPMKSELTEESVRKIVREELKKRA
ncbi:MAG: BrnA antitoxin family protein [Oligoflexia bacterium]|nr:BrnA antitoxin family protein [Oligoflexia bacterium]